MTKEDRREVGSDIFIVQKGFPLGYPLAGKIDTDLWEVRSVIAAGICRVFFTIHGQMMILLHGFVKKTQKTPEKELQTARSRLKEFRRMNK